MKAIRQYEFGAPEVLRYEDVPDPVPGPGQVRIDVRASGVHLLDTAVRAGEGSTFGLPDLPMTPGREVAGIVDAVGEGVPDEWVGRRVVAHLWLANGGYAEKAVRDVEAVHPLPDALDFPAAVALIGTGRTAMGVLHTAAITSADTVIVTGAASGLGGLLTQAAVHTGARVIGMAGGPAKTALVASFGAETVDYLAPDWTLGDVDATVVLDGNGGETGRAALERLVFGGRLVLFGRSSGEPVALSAADLFERGIIARSGVGLPLIESLGGLRAVERMALSASFTPVITGFPLADAAEAHRAIEERRTMGKVVLVP